MDELAKQCNSIVCDQICILSTEKRIEEDIGLCRGCIMTCDVDGINSAIKSMVGRSRRVCQVGERIIDNHDDPLYRNGLLVYIKALHKGKQKYKNKRQSNIQSNLPVQSPLLSSHMC